MEYCWTMKDDLKCKLSNNGKEIRLGCKFQFLFWQKLSNEDHSNREMDVFEIQGKGFRLKIE